MRALTTFQDLMARHIDAKIIPLLELTAYRDRFDDVTKATQLIRISDVDRVEVGVEWAGALAKWGGIGQGIRSGIQVETKWNNQIGLYDARRFTDILRVGLNTVDTWDPTFWDARLLLLVRGGTAGEELWWARLIMEEPQNITEAACEVRFSGADLFLNQSDPSNLPPATIITVGAVGHDGKKSGQGRTLTATMASANEFRYLLVWVLRTSAVITPTDPTSFTYGAQALTLVATQDSIVGGMTAKLYLYELVAPAVGSAALTIFFGDEDEDGSPLTSDKVMGGVMFNNVLQSSPRRGFASAAIFSEFPTVLPSSVRGDLVADGAGYWFEAGILPPMAADPGQTERVNRSDEGSPGSILHRARMGCSTKLGGDGSIQMRWTINPSSPAGRNWVAIGTSLVPAF